MKIKLLALLLGLWGCTLPTPAGTVTPITPILVSNGLAKLPCDNAGHFIYTTPLVNKTIIGSYLFANLLTDPSAGADIVLWSPAYGAEYPPPWVDGPSSQFGTIGDLHTFSQPAGHTGGRQGQSERWFPAGTGIHIANDVVQIVYICAGLGTVEIYALLWVIDGPTP